ncbi:MAG: hypothetical protein JW966_03950 [Anaerolineae bacterium]|nr:hypothetical protein [Anaerolineae bacterium]
MNQHTNPERGPLLSDHPHPRPALRRITEILAGSGLAGGVVGVIGLLVSGIGLRLPLLPLMAVFLVALLLLLVQLTVLHPRVTVYEHGLWIKPLLWPGCWVRWDAVARIEDHTLIRRGQEKPRHTEHTGRLIVVENGLSLPFVIIGIMAGLGRVRVFGISTFSHTGYKALYDTIRAHTRHA